MRQAQCVCYVVFFRGIYSSLLKGAVCNSDPIHFLSNSANISSWPACFPFCVCAEKKSGVHTRPWLCKQETNSMAQTGLPTRSHSQVVKCRRFVTTHARAEDNTNTVCYLREFDGGIIFCVYCEYLPLNLSPVSCSFIIGVSKSINIHCI